MKILIRTCLILIFVNTLSCLNHKKENNDYTLDEKYSINSNEIIENYIVNEILDYKKYPNEYLDNADGVIKIYGKPLMEEAISIEPYYFEGGNAISMRKIIYWDLTHYYFVFENGKQIYANVEVNEPLERLKTVNIGDTFDRLKNIFGGNYYEYNNKISYYGLNQELIFHIENNIIIKIFINYLLI